MKSKRRQELKTNDLAAWLDDVRHSASKWGAYLGIGLVLVIAVVVINSNMRKARLEARASAYEDLQKASSMQIAKMDKTDDELRSSLNKIDDLVAGSADPNFRINALFDKANMASNLAQRAMGGSTGAAAEKSDPDQAKKFLAESRAAYEQIIREYSDRTLYYGRALYGRFQVDALAFVLDGDPAHRTAAAESLEKLRDETRFNATPLQTVAIGHLKNLDQMFTPLEFPSRPSPSPTAAPVTLGPLVPGEPAALTPPVATPVAESAAPESTMSDTATPEPAAATPDPAAATPAPAADSGEAAEPAGAEPPATPEAGAAAPQDVAPEGE